MITTERDLPKDVAAELEAAAQMIRELLPPCAVFVVHTTDMRITSHTIHATGTQSFIVKPIDREKS